MVAKQDRITVKDPRPTAFSVPKREKKIGGVKEETEKEETKKKEKKKSIC